MGNACGGVGSEEENKISREIENNLTKDLLSLKNETKILLLGTGESGKSTIVKQLRFLYLENFGDEEIRSYIPIVHNNVISSMFILCKHLLANNEFDDQSEKIKEQAILMGNPETSLRSDLDSELSEAIKSLWSLQKVKDLFHNKGQLQVIESVEYFFNDIDRISARNFKPTDTDIIMSRTKTVGINEISFKLAGRPIKLVDVGGQRSERRKWIHCFEEVTVIFFIVAISEYDQVLREDSSTNRLTESMNLFNEITTCQWFQPTPLFLFLNKSDLFQSKLSKVSLSSFFPDWTGGTDYTQATAFLEKKFMALNGNPNRQIYTHVTCATNRDNVGFVFKSFQSVFLQQNLNQMFL